MFVVHTREAPTHSVWRLLIILSLVKSIWRSFRFKSRYWRLDFLPLRVVVKSQSCWICSLFFLFWWFFNGVVITSWPDSDIFFHLANSFSWLYLTLLSYRLFELTNILIDRWVLNRIIHWESTISIIFR